MVIISHGANKLGGFNYSANNQNSTSGIVTDETTNIRASNFDSIFVTNSNSPGFDDVILFKNRIGMAVDAGFEDMICRSADADYTGTTCFNGSSNVSVSLTWNTAKYRQELDANQRCPTGCRNDSPTLHSARRCQKYGVWGPVLYICK
jgi:hypothetical protein